MLRICWVERCPAESLAVRCSPHFRGSPDLDTRDSLFVRQDRVLMLLKNLGAGAPTWTEEEPRRYHDA